MDVNTNTHIHALTTEMYKAANDMSPGVMNGVFKLRNIPHYNLRHILHFSTDPIPSVYDRTESVSYLGPEIWIPAEIKNKDSLDGFNPLHPNPGQREKINLNFFFHTSLCCLKRFYEGL